MPCIPFQNQNLKSYYKTYRHLLPSGPANLTASASLQPIRGMHIQLHGPLHRRCSNLDRSIIQAMKFSVRQNQTEQNFIRSHNGKQG
jgi:hypothetical protein